MNLDQNQAAQLQGVARWRAVYQYAEPDGPSRAETIAWFELTAEAAWAEAAAHLPPTGYRRPSSVTIERGTFTSLPEGGHGWQPLGPTLTARIDNHGLVLDGNSAEPEPVLAGTGTVAAGQQHLF